MLYISKQRSPPSSVAASAALARPRRSPRSRSKLTRSSQSTPMRPYVCTPMSLSSLGLAALGCAAHLGQHVGAALHNQRPPCLPAHLQRQPHVLLHHRHVEPGLVRHAEHEGAPVL